MAHKLSLDEKEALEELLSSNELGLKALWKEADSALSLFEAQVLHFSLDSPDQTTTRLLILKARAEGAAQLLSALKKRLAPNKQKSRVAT